MTPITVLLERVDPLLAAIAEGSERDLLAAATAAVASLLGDRASCVLVDGTPRVALSTSTPTMVDWPLNLVRYPEIVTAIDRRALVTIEDTHAHPLLTGVRPLLPRNLRAVAVVPLLAGSRCLGVLIAQSERPRRYSADELAVAQLIGKLAGTQVDRHRRQPAGPLRPIVHLPTPTAPVSADDRARRILIVEDDPDVAADLREVLAEEKRYTITVALDGEDGLKQAQADPPDLILLDVMMPVLDGFSTAQRLAEDPITRDVPILFLSGTGELPTRIRGLKLRSADFLAKPFSAQELFARIERSMQQLALREQLRHDAYTDELTGLGNLRLFHERLALEEARSERYGTPLALVVIDVDRLKQINDTHGHAMGSEALRAVGTVLRNGVRQGDVAVRYGGDEFVVLLPHAGVAEGRAFAERVLDRLRKERPAGIDVTVSIGIAATVSRCERSMGGLLEKADAAVYRAKRLGGDRLCVDETTLQVSVSSSG